MELVVDDFPFGVDDGLVIFGFFDSDFGVFLLSLELEFDIEGEDFGVGKLLGLLFETGIGEGFLEGDSADEETVSDGASRDHLDSDEFLFEEVGLEGFDGLDDEFGEVGLVGIEEFGVEGGLSASDEHFSSLLWVIPGDFDGVFVKVLHDFSESSFVALDDDLWVHSFFDESFAFFKKFAGQHADGGGSITDFVILRFSNINKSFSSWVNNIKKIENSSSIITDSSTSSTGNHLIHTSWSKSSLNNIYNSLNCIDI